MRAFSLNWGGFLPAMRGFAWAATAWKFLPAGAVDERGQAIYFHDRTAKEKIIATAIAFDSLDGFENLKAAGKSQARAQVEMVRSIVHSYDESSRKDLATKGDIQDVRAEIAETKHEILKWVLGIALAQTAVIISVIGLGIAFVMKQ